MVVVVGFSVVLEVVVDVVGVVDLHWTTVFLVPSGQMVSPEMLSLRHTVVFSFGPVQL